MDSTENEGIHTIGTHSGTFHCDEALAIYMLLQLYPTAKIVRTRDQTILNTLPIIVDVGAEYDTKKHRYDHHQRGFNETLDDKHTMKLSSAGLIYKHFGKNVIKIICENYLKSIGKINDTSNSKFMKDLPDLSDGNIDIIYQKVYNSFIESIDGLDNGISQYPNDVDPLYKNNTDLSSRVSWLNPGWNEVSSDELLYSRFLEAVKLSGSDFNHFVLYTYKNWFPARTIVLNSINERFNIHESGHILLLNEFTIWKSHLFELENELKNLNRIYYVLYCDSSCDWRIQCVPINENSFTSRMPLPEQWRGLRNEELSKICNIDNCIFVHSSGFIGGNKTLKGVKQMAISALQINQIIKTKT